MALLGHVGYVYIQFAMTQAKAQQSLGSAWFAQDGSKKPEGTLAKLAKLIGMCEVNRNIQRTDAWTSCRPRKIRLPNCMIAFVSGMVSSIQSIPIAGAPVGFNSPSCHTAQNCAGGNQKLVRI